MADVGRAEAAKYVICDRLITCAIVENMVVENIERSSIIIPSNCAEAQVAAKAERKRTKIHHTP